MEDFKVETDIEMPRRRNERWPWAKMEVGDSFFTPANGQEMKYVRSKISTCALSWGKRHSGERFATRVTDENGGRGVRIWRVA